MEKHPDEHTWVERDGDSVTLGLLKESAEKTEFVFIDLPEKGQRLNKGDVYVSLESAKWSGHLRTPVAGTVVEVNEELFDEPSRLRTGPWICTLRGGTDGDEEDA